MERREREENVNIHSIREVQSECVIEHWLYKAECDRSLPNTISW